MEQERGLLFYGKFSIFMPNPPHPTQHRSELETLESRVLNGGWVGLYCNHFVMSYIVHEVEGSGQQLVAQHPPLHVSEEQIRRDVKFFTVSVAKALFGISVQQLEQKKSKNNSTAQNRQWTQKMQFEKKNNNE
jgi:hypothetical protein